LLWDGTSEELEGWLTKVMKSNKGTPDSDMVFILDEDIEK
jgi:hypothetical protein